MDRLRRDVDQSCSRIAQSHQEEEETFLVKRDSRDLGHFVPIETERRNNDGCVRILVAWENRVPQTAELGLEALERVDLEIFRRADGGKKESRS